MPNAAKKPRVQDDFYQHVNYDWLSKARIPSGESGWGTFWQLQETAEKRQKQIVDDLVSSGSPKTGSVEEKVRDFYLSSTHRLNKKKGLAVVDELFHKIDNCRNKKDLSELIAQLHLSGVDAFWSAGAVPDFKNTDVYRLAIEQAGLTLPSKDYYFKRTEAMLNIRREYKKHIARMWAIFVTGLSSKIAQRNIINIERELASKSMDPVELRDIDRLYNKRKLTQLQSNTQQIDWLAYLKKLGARPPQFIIVEQPDFIAKVNEVLAKSSHHEIACYLKWQVIASLAHYISEDIAKENFKFFGTVLNGTPHIKVRWKRSLATIDSCIGEAMAKAYTDRFFPRMAKVEMEKLVKNLLASYRGRLSELDWMSSSTKRMALKKLASMNFKVGYSDKMENYAQLKISNSRYLANVINSRMFNAQKNLAKVDRPVDPDEWLMNAHTVNAYYSVLRNEIVFPAGILQPPFFDLEADKGANYGAIGFVIGHEITHGFDDKGSKFDENGVLKNWWDKATRSTFDKKTAGMVLQANNFETLPGVHLKGELTLGENIADLGGAEIAFCALKLAVPNISKDSEQSFFKNLAIVWRKKVRPERQMQLAETDPHAPGDFRVNNTLRNMDSFYKVFDVKAGDKMYLAPEKRVRIW